MSRLWPVVSNSGRRSNCPWKVDHWNPCPFGEIRYRDRLPVRLIEDAELIDHQTILGKRQPIAAVEKTLYGMRAGGYREVLAGAHLCYGDLGVEGLIPPRAMLRIRLWVQSVQQGTG